MSAWEPQLRGDEEDPMAAVVYQAIGTGSMCWSEIESAGVFQDQEAARVAEGLLTWLRGRA